MAKTIISHLLQIFNTSVSAVRPENLIKKSLSYNPCNQELIILNKTIDVKNKNVYLVGAGKAVQNMAREVENMLGSKIKSGIISIPNGSLNNSVQSNVIYCEGAENNLPDINAETTAKKIKKLITSLTENDILIVLISGGGSALLPLPKQPMTLQEKTKLIKKIANSGADIKELNCVRKFLSDLKGGQLAIQAQPAKVIALILSDIVGDPLDLIASGPTVQNSDSPSKAFKIISKYNLNKELPNSVEKVFDNYMETKFPFKNVENYIIGSNKCCIAASIDKATNLGYTSMILSHTITGDLKYICDKYVKLSIFVCDFISELINFHELKSIIYSLNIDGLNPNFIEGIKDSINKKDICIVMGGEITLEVKGRGKGGRNQHLALQFSTEIERNRTHFQNFDIYFLSAGTDGIDGPTDAAGAIAYLGLVNDAKSNGMNVQQYLNNYDSYNFYNNFNQGSLHIITGHTNTNVMDIHIILIKRN